MTEEDQLKMIDNTPWMIRHIENPTEKVKVLYDILWKL